MASIYNLKPAFQKLLRPFSDGLAKRKITPNQVTITAVIISFITGLLIYFNPNQRWVMLLVPIVLLLRMILNAIDGMLAREHQMQTALGTFLNELGDVFSDTFLYLPFCMIEGIAPFLVIIIVILAICSEMTGVIALQIGAVRRYEGPMGKSDRAFVFGVIGLLLGLGMHANLWINGIFGITILLLIYTIINRILYALKEAKQ